MATIMSQFLLGDKKECELKDGRFIIISRYVTPKYGEELMAFLSNGKGEIIEEGDFYFARKKWLDDMSDEAAIEFFES